MKSSPYITLYDTPSSQSNGWAPSIWRIRLILNYKRLPYRTKWIEVPDIDRTMRQIGAPHTSKRSDGRPVFTLPVIVDPIRSPTAPVVLSNASAISEYLEITYPARPLYPDGSKALQTLFVHYLQDVFMKPLLPIMIPLSAQRLNPRSQEYIFPSNQRPPPDAGLSGPQREQAWQAVRENFKTLSDILDKNSGEDGDGVVVSGRDITYADFALCAILIWIERVSPQDVWPLIRSWNGGRWARLMDRCRDYMDVM
ncbi:uncharacterized protein FOMMEDRAFT_101922 [Fomitiporia mediterranea MF3/22]|uniref:uncharacterized protein n=1 Tax=Fomitiporia mediterranea (strain MF3/22) TaxID=694068 RepID=UPI000440730B|nr:uncharacterized protein FOMMEDRAFT_101922 [Fomitiporia mediterranea MF3/22]EJD08503.1 hypothetical protein FOMMEDRAFT_101922 [Fomitiporia mediterranea MF3/22]